LKRVHYFVHGRGRGHATRTLPIVQLLRDEGCSVRVHAGDDAQALFAAEADLVRVRSTMPRPGRGERFAATGARLVAQRVSEARALFSEDRPDLVITDGDLPGALAALAHRIPSIAVGHGLVFSHCKRPIGTSARAWILEGPKAALSAIGARYRVAVNFVPVEPKDRATFVGKPTLRAALRLPSREAGGAGGGDATRDDKESTDVLCYFRMGDGSAVASALGEVGTRARIFAPPDMNIEGSEPIDEAKFTRALLEARAVVANAGSQIIGECVALGIPFFGVYSDDFHEQSLNVAMLRAHRIGDGTSFERFEPTALAAFLDRAGELRTRLAELAPMPLAADLVRDRALELLDR
jgi:UDP-N-acetylglucosamine:LPS N-acetylglucosamine transferase